MKLIGEKLFPNNVALCALTNMSLQLLSALALIAAVIYTTVYIPYSCTVVAVPAILLFWVIIKAEDIIANSFRAFDGNAVIVSFSTVWCMIMAAVTYNSALTYGESVVTKNFGSILIAATLSLILSALTCIIVFPFGKQALAAESSDTGAIKKYRLAATLIGIEIAALMLAHGFSTWIVSGVEIMCLIAITHTISYVVIGEKFSYKTAFICLSFVNSAIVNTVYQQRIVERYHSKIAENITYSLILSIVEMLVLYGIHQLYLVNLEKCRVKTEL